MCQPHSFVVKFSMKSEKHLKYSKHSKLLLVQNPYGFGWNLCLLQVVALPLDVGRHAAQVVIA